MTKKNNLDDLLTDVAYLLDELNALKKVITAIPYNERPLGQESILDMIERIGYAQSACFLPAVYLILEVENDVRTEIADSEINRHYHKSFEPAGEEERSEGRSVNEVIDSIIEDRKTLLDLLNQVSVSAFYKTIPFNSLSDMNLYDFIREMVTYEIHQLKQVAERVMSIDVEHRTGSETNSQ